MQNQKRKTAIFYARVSTDHREQDSSIDSQKLLAKKFFSQHPEIELVEPLDTYVERESAKSDTRPGYTALMERLSKGDVDYLAIKDLKRLNRSSEVSAKLRRLCKEYGFKLLLLDTSQEYDPNSEQYRMMYGFESLMNEEYVLRQSAYGKLAHRQKMDAKRLNRNNVRFGFRWDYETGTMVIYEDEAKVIRAIFDLYVFRNKGVKEIRNYLAGIGYSYSTVTVRKWLSDTTYIGIWNMNKRANILGVGVGEKTKRIDLPREEWITVEKPELCIVEKEVFDLAQRLRKSRMRRYQPDKNGNVQGRFVGKHLFSSLVFCGSCKYPYLFRYSDRNKSTGVYIDSFSVKGKALESCPNPNRRLYERDLITISVCVINNLIENSSSYIDEFMAVVSAVFHESSDNKEKKEVLERKISNLKKKSEKTKMAYIQAAGPLKASLEEDYNLLYNQISEAEEELRAMENLASDKQQAEGEMFVKLKMIQDTLLAASVVREDTITRQIIEAFFHKIYVYSNSRIVIEVNMEGLLREQAENKNNHISFERVVYSSGISCSNILKETPLCTFQYKSPIPRKKEEAVYDVNVVLGNLV